VDFEKSVEQMKSAELWNQPPDITTTTLDRSDRNAEVFKIARTPGPSADTNNPLDVANIIHKQISLRLPKVCLPMNNTHSTSTERPGYPVGRVHFTSIQRM
jgi:hypothetical protein